MIRTKLADTRGEFTVSGAIKLIAVAIALALIISVTGVLVRVPTLNTMTDEALRYIEVRGRVDNAAYAEIQRLQRASNLNCIYTIDADYMAGTEQIQFGDAITVTMRHTVYFGVGGIMRVPVTLTARSEGRSEQYWK